MRAGSADPGTAFVTLCSVLLAVRAASVAQMSCAGDLRAGGHDGRRDVARRCAARRHGEGMTHGDVQMPPPAGWWDPRRETSPAPPGVCAGWGHGAVALRPT
jgi:hypothetical protein